MAESSRREDDGRRAEDPAALGPHPGHPAVRVSTELRRPGPAEEPDGPGGEVRGEQPPQHRQQGQPTWYFERVNRARDEVLLVSVDDARRRRVDGETRVEQPLQHGRLLRERQPGQVLAPGSATDPGDVLPVPLGIVLDTPRTLEREATGREMTARPRQGPADVGGLLQEYDVRSALGRRDRTRDPTGARTDHHDVRFPAHRQPLPAIGPAAGQPRSVPLQETPFPTGADRSRCRREDDGRGRVATVGRATTRGG